MANKIISIKWLVDQINEYTNKYQYFWSYGLLKETSNIWKNKNNYNLLNEASQIICDDVFISTLK